MQRLGYGDLTPASLRRYVAAVSVLGPALALAVASTRDGRLSLHDAVLAVVLTVMAAFAERFPLNLTHKTTINVASAAYIAMILSLPYELPGVLALVAIGVAQAVRWRANPTLEFSESMFNVAQGALYTTAAALAYGALHVGPDRPDIASVRGIAAIAVAAVVMHVVNTGAVAGAAGLQVGVSPLRVWWRTMSLDLVPHVTMTVVGVLAAMIASEWVWLLPILALPVVLVQRAVQDAVRLRADPHDALAALVEVVELRDPYTAGHSRRIAATSRLIAHQLGMTEEEADVIESAGRVHDIGKVALDPLVLVKTGALTADEWRQMELHPVYGANVIDRFQAYRDGARYVRHHHERWDGTGYPDRLAGEAIPIGARILAVADAFDAMTSDRPYREGMAVERAAGILRDGGGFQWDARIVEAFLAVLAARPEAVPIHRRHEGVAAGAAAPVPQPASTSATEAA